MKYILSIYLLFLLPLCTKAQTGEMLVYTVAGDTLARPLGDGGQATAARLLETEGIWMDGECNLYISDLGDSRIRKVNIKTGIITTVAGTTNGFSGDGGPATNAQMVPYGLYVDPVGTIFIADAGNNRIRKVDGTTGIITTFAGGGVSLGDGGPATNAQINNPANVYGDPAGNIYIGEAARIRKVDLAGNISTIAGTGLSGLSGDGGLAVNAQVYGVSGMLFDTIDNLYFADRANSRVRKINMATGIITTIAGSTFGFSGDGGLATNAELNGIISFVIDKYGNLVIGDNGNNYLRKVDAITGVITTIAGMGPTGGGSRSDGEPATNSKIHPEFMYLDLSGNIYFSNWADGQVRKVINYNPSLKDASHNCDLVGIPEIQLKSSLSLGIYPNPPTTSISVYSSSIITQISIANLIGQVVYSHNYNSEKVEVNIADLPNGVYFVKVNGSEVRRFVKE